MNIEDFNKIYESLKTRFSDYSSKVFDGVKTESNLSAAMKYSFSAGGKRIRPVIMLFTANMLGGNEEEILPFAFALECIHTYSLIHDDLPALDNDDLRRGKPTNHKVFGEATAILSGDALLNFAFEHMLLNCDDLNKVKAAQELAVFAGHSGMLEGQALDIESEKSANFGEERLLKIVEHKTAKFITAALTLPAIVYSSDKLPQLTELGENLGKLFQFADDLKDVLSTSEKLGKTVGKDEREDKLSAVKVYGIGGVKDKIKELKTTCKELASSLDKSGFLDCFIDFVSA